MKRRILLEDLMERRRQFILVSMVLGSHGQTDHGRWKGDDPQSDIAEASAGVQFLHFGDGHDFTGWLLRRVLYRDCTSSKGPSLIFLRAVEA